ncbi:RAS guanyl-releasing protein 4-like [Chiloscyllium plagiosum]|uniref:RAS guanyl-releasing protein 4-like n=1 Tax=Chiloscyllium plagiosum TaxID=36176 RepID=UPI001CB7AF1A|nr:RAS guanyl-releasing protein 4-like [Chiloscyllium plagiosum]
MAETSNKEAEKPAFLVTEKSATIDEMIQACINEFDDRGRLKNRLLPHMFLMMHQWYLPSTELVGKLLQLYPSKGFCLKPGSVSPGLPRSLASVWDMASWGSGRTCLTSAPLRFFWDPSPIPSNSSQPP